MMKTKFYALLFFLTVAMSGCDNEYDDTGIRTQIAEVTDQVKALQTLTEALQNRDYILSVVPTTVEGVPGYLITFAQAEPVTILCGTSVIAAVDTSHGDYVVFTLADGTTTITLPRSNAVTIGLDGYDVLYCTASSLDIPLLFPSTLKSGDYTSIAATVTNDNGTGTDIQTRASAGTNGVWKVDITQPAFGDDGMIIPNSSKVTLTPPKHVKLSDTAILKVTLVDKKGMETTVTRPIKYSTVAAVTSTAGNLSSVATDAEMTALAIKGSVDATDLAYIRNTLTKLEVLDLSMTDMVTLPGWGLGFHPDDGYQPNTTLKEVMLPASLVTIGKSAFLNCRALDYVDTGNAETITEYAFEGCSNLREVILSEKLKTVGNCAFRNCVSLSLIDIPGSVETLGRWVFENCGNLQSVVLHEGVQSLSESTFYGCGIRSVSIPSTVTSIPKWTFQDCKYLEHVNWHDGITSIGEAAFNRCTSLRNIRIPARVTAIEPVTFLLLYVQRGVKLTNTANGASTDVKTQSIDIPIELKWEMGISDNFDLFLGVGPSFSFLVDEDNWGRKLAHIAVDVIDKDLSSMGWRSTEVGINLGGGVKIVNHLMLSCYYNIGLTQSAKHHIGGNKHDAIDQIFDGDVFESKNRYWQLSLSYVF